MINQATIIFTILLAITTLIIPRRYFLAPFIVAACFVPADQRVIIMDLDFTPLRVLVLAGVIRLWASEEAEPIKWNRFDKMVISWAVVGAVIYVIQWADIRSLIFKCGVLFDVLGLYYIFRQSVRTWTTIHLALRILALCALVLLPFVIVESVTGENPFVILGRVHTVVRESGYNRCQASFPHSIMLGLFWGTLVPLFIALGRTGQWKILSWAGAAAATLIVLFTVSSTPIVALACVLALLPLFPFRRYGRAAVWSLCALIAALHVLMKAPVWHLISRINIIGGSTGYHRYRLIDLTIRHFGDWALLGTQSTAHWGLTDITNQYSLEAVQGGLVTLLLFIGVLIVAVRTVGKYSLQDIPRSEQWLAWGICVSILGHCVSFMGVSYFGQIRMLLYLTLAIVGVIYEGLYAPSPAFEQWSPQDSVSVAMGRPLRKGSNR